MKASELRIGNLVTAHDGKSYYVSNLSLDIDDEYNELIGAVLVGNTSNEVLREERELYWKPIPLTEEWLLKFGFGPSEMDECGHNTNENFGFYYDYHFKRFRLEVNDGAHIVDVHPNIQYVHQLQNLYFALTGQELTIKE